MRYKEHKSNVLHYTNKVQWQMNAKFTANIIQYKWDTMNNRQQFATIYNMIQWAIANIYYNIQYNHNYYNAHYTMRYNTQRAQYNTIQYECNEQWHTIQYNTATMPATLK